MTPPAGGETLRYVDQPVDDRRLLLDLARDRASRFTSRHEGSLTGLRAHFASLVLTDADQDVVRKAVRSDLLPATPDRVVLSRYAPGDYSLPHRLSDELAGTTDPVDWVLLCPLTGSTDDATTIWDGRRFVRVPDSSGTALTAGPATWSWTSPVRRTRYTLALGGRRA